MWWMTHSQWAHLRPGQRWGQHAAVRLAAPLGGMACAWRAHRLGGREAPGRDGAIVLRSDVRAAAAAVAAVVVVEAAEAAVVGGAAAVVGGAALAAAGCGGRGGAPLHLGTQLRDLSAQGRHLTSLQAQGEARPWGRDPGGAAGEAGRPHAMRAHAMRGCYCRSPRAWACRSRTWWLAGPPCWPVALPSTHS